MSLLLVDANVYDCFFSFIFFENHLEDGRVGGLGKMESKGHDDGWGARIFVLVVVPTHLSTYCFFRGLSRAAAKEKKTLTRFVVILTHGCLIHFFSYFWEGLFFSF